MPTCPICGRKLEEEERFCYNCDIDVSKEVLKDEYSRAKVSDKNIFEQLKDLYKKLENKFSKSKEKP